MQIVLASGSPRRKELMSLVCRDFTVYPAKRDEITYAQTPEDMVKELAANKAEEVFGVFPECAVIGCDTVVSLEGEIFGKPCSRENAVAMLGKLSGQTHTVFTGVCVLYGKRKVTFVERSGVTFRVLSEDEIIRYVDTGSPFDKAGGYGIQDSGFVCDIMGSYYNVMGLPVERLKEELEAAGIIS